MWGPGTSQQAVSGADFLQCYCWNSEKVRVTCHCDYIQPTRQTIHNIQKPTKREHSQPLKPCDSLEQAWRKCRELVTWKKPVDTGKMRVMWYSTLKNAQMHANSCMRLCLCPANVYGGQGQHEHAADIWHIFPFWPLHAYAWVQYHVVYMSY